MFTDKNLTVAQRLLLLVTEIGNEEQKTIAMKVFADLPIAIKFKKGDTVLIEIHREKLQELLPDINKDTLEKYHWHYAKAVITEDCYYGTDVITNLGKYHVIEGVSKSNASKEVYDLTSA